MRRSGVITGLVLLAACAQAPRPMNMVPRGAGVAPDSRLRRAVTVGVVTGGKDTNPLTYSRVSAGELREALALALRTRDMLSPDPAGAAFRLDAGILEAADTSRSAYVARVHSVIRYALRARDGTTVFDRVVEGTGEVTVGEVFYGVERLRVANERSILANLSTAMAALSAR